MKHYCKNCGSEIITKRMKLPICPICLNATILLHQPTLVDIRRLETEARHLIEVPAWETPEQYEKRTGEKWPDDWAVYSLNELNECNAWSVGVYKHERLYMKDHKTMKAIVCATEAGRPPDDWRPEEEPK